MPRPSGSARGSFGIPNEIHPETLKRQREEREAQRQAQDGSAGASSTDPEFSSEKFDTDGAAQDDGGGESDGEAPSPGEAEKKPDDTVNEATYHPLRVLEKVGVILTPEDFSQLLFKGFIEKDIKITTNPLDGSDYIGRFRTLTPQEFDEIDECVAEEMKGRELTRDGLETRRTMWTLTFALVGINGRLFVPPATHANGQLDTKKTALLRKPYVSSLYHGVANQASIINATFIRCLNLIMKDPQKSFLKKP